MLMPTTAPDRCAIKLGCGPEEGNGGEKRSQTARPTSELTAEGRGEKTYLSHRCLLITAAVRKSSPHQSPHFGKHTCEGERVRWEDWYQSLIDLLINMQGAGSSWWAYLSKKTGNMRETAGLALFKGHKLQLSATLNNTLYLIYSIHKRCLKNNNNSKSKKEVI